LLGPRSYNPVKGEPFECGIPTRGSSWIPVNIGYYLFAILFLMFDIETVFLYPWAVVVKQFGPMALVSIGVFADIGVVLAHQLAVGLFDVGQAGIFGHAEDVVVGFLVGTHILDILWNG